MESAPCHGEVSQCDSGIDRHFLGIRDKFGVILIMPIDIVPISASTEVNEAGGVLNTRSGRLMSESFLVGETDGQLTRKISVTSEGHIEAAIHAPRNPFGSLHVENLNPIFQCDAAYGINTQLVNVFTGLGGKIAQDSGQFILSTHTTVGGNATLQSKKRLRYRPGQGAVARFTAVFSSGVANSFQVVGLGTPTDGLYFGYSGTDFGILHARHGVREIQTLDLSSFTSSSGNVTVVLNGTSNSVLVSGAAGSGYRTAYELSTGSYNGWFAEPLGSGVIFLANSVGNKTGLFSLSGNGTNVSGSFTKSISGKALTESWISQSDWNQDKMNGSGACGVLLNPLVGNVYQVKYQFLGYGVLSFQIESAPEGNDADWITVHSIDYPNNNIVPSFSNPSFPYTASAYSMGSTTNLEVKAASFAGFVEGQKKLNGPTFTYSETSTSVTTSLQALYTIKNRYVFKNKSNQCVVNVLGISAAVKLANNLTTIYIIKNGILVGNPNFQNYSANSCTSYDKQATSVTYTDNESLLFSFSLGETDSKEINLRDYDIDLQPGESITIAAKTSGGTASFLTISLNTREDQ